MDTSGVFVTAFRSWERGSEVWETLQIARTTSDYPRRMSPAANTFFTVVA